LKFWKEERKERSMNTEKIVQFEQYLLRRIQSVIEEYDMAADKLKKAMDEYDEAARIYKKVKAKMQKLPVDPKGGKS